MPDTAPPRPTHSAAPDRAACQGADLLERVLRHPTGAAGWLLQHRNGLLHAQLTEALARVLLACHDTGKPGELTLKIRIRPNPDYAGQMVISDQVVARPPEQASSVAYLFDADALRLQGEEPGQLSIPLTD